MFQTIRIAFRDLGRNRRRSFFSALAVGMGLALLMLLAGFIHGEYGGAIDTSIRLQSGNIQVRAAKYDEIKTSLKWEDLVQNPDDVAAKIAALPQVSVATPRLFATGIAQAGNDSTGVSVMGIDPASLANDPYRQGLLSGQFLTADDSGGVLIGQPLAEKLNLRVGDNLNLSVNTSNGDVISQPFVVRGIYTTNTNGFDSVTVFMPLAKAQAITQTQKHASTIFVLLKDRDQTDAVAAALQGPDLKVLTWEKLNNLLLETETLANSYIFLFYLIILGITATVIVNTLIMAVFERTREIGILMAIGMKSYRIMGMFLSESALLAVGGIIMGLVLGSLVVGYFTSVGFYIGNMGITGFLIGNTVRPELTLADTVNLVILSFIVTLLAGLYPAWMAAHLQPVEALHGGK